MQQVDESASILARCAFAPSLLLVLEEGRLEEAPHPKRKGVHVVRLVQVAKQVPELRLTAGQETVVGDQLVRGSFVPAAEAIAVLFVYSTDNGEGELEPPVGVIRVQEGECESRRETTVSNS